MKKHISGFTLIEILVVIAIIGTLSTIIFISFRNIIPKARDAKRKSEITQMGRLLTGSCYLPDAGSGDYDLSVIIEELRMKYPQYSDALANIPKDPKSGTETESFYRYIVSDDGTKCALYANLENENEKVTLINISVPFPGGGTGVFQATSAGWNGTLKYFQVSS